MLQDLSPLRVLLADDNKHMRAIVVAMLRSVGVRHIVEANDGGEAMTFLDSFRPDIAIVDLRMAPLSGLEFTRLVRSGTGAPDPMLPILMMTGHTEISRVAEARDIGVTEFVSKPVTALALFQRIEAIIVKPRAFVRADDYFGPDRRRSSRPYQGPMRRARDRSA